MKEDQDGKRAGKRTQVRAGESCRFYYAQIRAQRTVLRDSFIVNFKSIPCRPSPPSLQLRSTTLDKSDHHLPSPLPPFL